MEHVAQEAPADLATRLSLLLHEHAIATKNALDSLPRDSMHAHGYEKILGETPFLLCGTAADGTLDLMASRPLDLQPLGKLAKGGSFFAVDGGHLLLKLVAETEAKVLRGWAQRRLQGSVGCEMFDATSSLLVGVPLVIRHGRLPYILMKNMTAELAVADSSWQVHEPYDVKPLPSLSKGLPQFIHELTQGFLKGVSPLREWHGWTDLRSLLKEAVAFFGGDIVDYSLLVHVLRSTAGSSASVPTSLGRGCIDNIDAGFIICIRVLDFMTPYTWLRGLESSWKADKFDDYGAKIMTAFDCLIDLELPSCSAYRALPRLIEASKASTGMAKATFIGTEAFRDNYICSAEVPRLTYQETMFHICALAKMYELKGGPTADRAELLQHLAASDGGTQSVGPQFKGFMQLAYMKSKQVADEDLAYNKSKDAAAHMPLDNLEACLDGVEKFSTEFYTGKTRNLDMHNVLWNPDNEHIIAVRGRPLMYSHREAVRRTRQAGCFLKTTFFRCSPREGGRVYFDYKHNFGDLEIMVLSARENSGQDLEISQKEQVRRQSVRACG